MFIIIIIIIIIIVKWKGFQGMWEACPYKLHAEHNKKYLIMVKLCFSVSFSVFSSLHLDTCWRMPKIKVSYVCKHSC